MKNLTERIAIIANNHDLHYDPKNVPIKIGPDVVLFYATKKSEQNAKLIPFYALTGKSTHVIESTPFETMQ